MNKIILTTIILMFVWLPAAHAYTLDEWADAIWVAEGCASGKCTYLYGIRSVSYKDEAEARQICKNTVYNTLVKYRSTRCRPGEKDITCLARRYAPIGAKNDPRGLNKNWKRNVWLHIKQK